MKGADNFTCNLTPVYCFINFSHNRRKFATWLRHLAISCSAVIGPDLLQLSLITEAWHTRAQSMSVVSIDNIIKRGIAEWNEPGEISRQCSVYIRFNWLVSNTMAAIAIGPELRINGETFVSYQHRKFLCFRTVHWLNKFDWQMKSKRWKDRK